MNNITPFNAVNKFFYFAMNRPIVYHKWKTSWGEELEGYMPEFLTKVNWNCNEGHIIEKWLNLNSDPYGQMFKFYADIDSENRESLVNWIMENYHGA